MAEEMKITLRAARANKGIRQKEAAKAIGITADLLKRIELGQSDPRFSVVLKLADLYEIPIDRICMARKSSKRG